MSDRNPIFLCLLCLTPLWACTQTQTACRSSRDCPAQHSCLEGHCRAVEGSARSPAQASPEACAQAQLPDRRDLVLHEIQASVPRELPWGDSNGDGLRDASEDEFIELLNLSGAPVLTQGVRLYKEGRDQPLVELTTPCLQPGQALVLLGGLRADAAPPSLPGAVVEVAPAPMRLADGGGHLRLLAPDDLVLFDGDYPGAQGGSVTLWPQRVSHDHLRPHLEISDRPSSMGLCADGQPFSSGCPAPAPACPHGRAPAPGDLWLHEVLSAVPEGPEGDSNGDGVTSATRDEFMELFSQAPQALRLEGVTLWKDGKRVGELPPLCLEPGQALVWWAGLEPGASPPQIEGAQVAISSRTWALRRQGNLLQLQSAQGEVLLEEALPEAQQGSLLRLEPGAPWREHALWSPSRLSPGLCPDGQALATGCEPCQGARPPRPGQLLLHELLPRAWGDTDSDQDGVVEPSGDEFVELVNAAPHKLALEGVRLEVDREARHVLAGCLWPGRALVLHSGQGELPQDEVWRQRAQRALRLGNQGATVTLVNAAGELLAVLAYGQAPPGRSLQLWPELDPEGEYVEHPEPGMSPGRCSDGSPLHLGCP